MWYDEAASVGYASLPFSQLLPALGHADAFFGLYYGLLHFVVAQSSNEVAIRALSAVAAVAFVPAVAYLANRLSGWRASVAAAFIASISPLLLRTAHEARPYSLLVLVSTLMTIAFLSALERPRPVSFALYAALSVLGCYLHVFAIFLVGAHVAWAAVYRPTMFRAGLAAAVIAIVVCIVPLVIVIFAPRHGAVNSFLVRPGLRALLTFLAERGFVCASCHRGRDRRGCGSDRVAISARPRGPRHADPGNRILAGDCCFRDLARAANV